MVRKTIVLKTPKQRRRAARKARRRKITPLTFTETLGATAFSPAKIIRIPRERVGRKGKQLLTRALVGSAVLGGVFTTAGRAAVIPVAKTIGKKAIRPKSLLIGLTAAGALTTSPTLREVAKSAISPRRTFQRGEELGKLIEDPSKLIPKEKETILQKAGQIAKEAGPAAAVAAAIAGVAALLKRRRERVGEVAPPTGVAPGAALPPMMPTAPPGAEVPLQPIGAAELPAAEVPAIVATPDIINKINFRPEIDIRVSSIGQKKTSKFINQQILVRS